MKEIIKERLRNVADRILMPLPKRAFEYLKYAVISLRSSGGIIHYYDFTYAKKSEDPVQKVKRKVLDKMEGMNIETKILCET